MMWMYCTNTEWLFQFRIKVRLMSLQSMEPLQKQSNMVAMLTLYAVRMWLNTMFYQYNDER